MRNFKQQLTAEVQAHTGVTLCCTEDEERVEQQARETAEELEYDFWAWSTATGLRCHTDPSKTPEGEEAAFLRELPIFLGGLLNWQRGPAVVVAHDIASVANHNEQSAPALTRMLRTVGQFQKGLNDEEVDDAEAHKRAQDTMDQVDQDLADMKKAYNQGDDKAMSEAAARMNKTAGSLQQQYEIPKVDRTVQLLLCDSEELVRSCGAGGVEMELPDREEAQTILDEFAEQREIVLDNQDQILDAIAGLTEHQIRKAVLLAFVQGNKGDSIDVQYLQQYKRQKLQAKGITWIDPDPSGFAAIGGLEPLKQWLLARKATFSKEAAEYGVEPARGVIISGPPGVAKSRLSSALAAEWSCPIVSLDIGATRAKYHGESEAHLRKALQTIDAISPAGGSPCVVLIDEVDRGLAGSTTSGDLDGGVAGRVFQTLLTWSAERTSAAFLYLSSNHPETIPSELTRAGRLDGMFWIDFPTEKERRSIVKIYKEAYPRATDVDVDVLVDRSAGRTGAEIEGGFREASVQALADGREQVTTLDVARALDALPIVKSTFELTSGMRSWKEAAIAASDINAATLVDTSTRTRPHQAN